MVPLNKPNNLADIIESSSNNRVMLFDANNNSYSTRNKYLNDTIAIAKNSVNKFINSYKINILDDCLNYLNTKVKLVEDATLELNKLNQVQGNIKYYTIQICKDKILPYLKFLERIEQLKFADTEYAHNQAEKFISESRKHINAIITDSYQHDQTSHNASVEITVAKKFFSCNAKEIRANLQLKQIFAEEVFARINELKKKEKFNIKSIYLFKDSMLDIVLEVCLANGVNICEYLNNMPAYYMASWQDHLTLKRIYNSIQLTTIDSLNQQYFAGLLHSAVKTFSKVHGVILEPFLNLLYSDIIDPKLLLNESIANVAATLQMLVLYSDSQNTIDYSKHISYIIELYNNQEDYSYKNDALYSAIWHKKQEITATLIEDNNYDPNVLGGYEQETILEITATRSDDQLLFQKLLDKGANPNLTNRYGQTVLMKLIDQQKLEYVEKLLEQPQILDINIQDKNGQTALWYALTNGSIKTSEKLRRFGAGF